MNDVLKEILKWSRNRPTWQQDALRRLVLNGELSDEDISSLTEICKSKQGLAEQQETNPLTEQHIPDRTAGALPVSLASIHHQQGVNALAEDQTLSFPSNLTIVYGDNGTGKTGYIRILKKACRARAQEDILGNVVSGKSSPATPAFNIKYRVGGNEQELQEWTGTGEEGFVSRVSVFDAQCATVHLTKETDVAFRPFGLDLFDKLVRACKDIQTKLEKEQSRLASSAIESVQAQIPKGTTVEGFLAKISSSTEPDDVRKRANLSAEDKHRFESLKKSLHDLQANDPKKLIARLISLGQRLQTLVKHLKHVETSLSLDAVTAVFDVRDKDRHNAAEAKQLRETTFPESMLIGTGSELWQAMWRSARLFSQESAYPGKEFPVVEDADCVLCQQHIGQDAAKRFKQFAAFMASTMERELRENKEKLDRQRKAFTDLETTTEEIKGILADIQIDDMPVADAIRTALDANENRRKAVLAALADDQNPGTNIHPPLAPVVRQADILVNEVVERIKALRANADDKGRERMTAAANELRARTLLATHQQIVLNDIERQKKCAAYKLCIEETQTHAITRKSTAVTKSVVSQQLKDSFKDELRKLSFDRVDVELKESGGTKGVFYHKIVLTHAPDRELPKVVSEGEQCCLSIAAFFAELSTADDRSGIVLDDPVSSLDSQWRDAVALRLVQEAKVRQVIVFTHDVVFLLRLEQYAENENVEQTGQHVRCHSDVSGVCSDKLPWVAMSTKKKIGRLKESCQDAKKLFLDNDRDAYEKDAKHLYGMLRETWERAIEAVLLNSVVERYRPDIQTKRIASITDEDCETIRMAMQKCSRWLSGHDQAAAACAPVPDPEELNADIDALETWVATIRTRRQNTKKH